MRIFAPNKTSAKLMIDYAAHHWNTDGESCHEAQRLKYLLLYDLYIKARSYAIINKLSFWIAVFGGVMVLAWPSLATFSKDFGFEREFLKSAIVQTTVTGIAALTFAVYSHYKKRQMYTENIMRQLIHSGEPQERLIQHVIQKLEKLDSGFVFSEAIGKQPKGRDRGTLDVGEKK